MSQVRIVVADDHPVFREGLVGVVTGIDGAELVACCSTGREAVAAVEEHEPDVVLMDLFMPEMDGIEATRRIVADHPRVAVLVLTMLDDDESVFAAIRAGARGYVVKGASPEDVVRAVDAVRAGEALFGPEVAQRLARFLAAPRPAPLPELTDREREVLVLVARGLHNGEIARQLVVSPKTVRNHVSNILAKLQVAGRAEAAERARAAGLGS
jgi:DNA-binding NarL/FixJ family response regulator